MASKNRRNKVKFKFTKELAFLLLALAIIIGVTVGLGIPTKAERDLAKINDTITSVNAENSTSYSTLAQDNHIRVISHKKLVEKINNNEKIIVWYGALTSGDYLQVISALDSLADLYDVDTVYLYYSTFVDEANENEETDTLAYKEAKQEMENALNANPECEKTIDLEVGNALFVYSDGKLIFNSQVGEDSSAYSMNNYLLKAFSLVI